MATIKFLGFTLVTLMLVLGTSGGTTHGPLRAGSYKGFLEGYCTYYAAQQFDNIAPSPKLNWHGDASAWVDNARRAGWATSTNPRDAETNALIVWTDGHFGHVAVVTSVGRDQLTVSEMNWGLSTEKPEDERNAITKNFNHVTTGYPRFPTLDRLGRTKTYRFVGYVFPRLARPNRPAPGPSPIPPGSSALPPTVSFQMSGGGRSAGDGQTLTYTVPRGGSVNIFFDASRSVAGTGAMRTYDWRSNGYGISSQQSFSYTLGPGRHAITLMVTNSAGLSRVTSATILVTEQSTSAAPPTSSAVVPTVAFSMSGGGRSASDRQTLSYTVPRGGNVNIFFDGSRSSAGSGSIRTYDWRSNGTTISAQRSFSFVFGAGRHSISLRVTNSYGMSSTAIATIVVN